MSVRDEVLATLHSLIDEIRSREPRERGRGRQRQRRLGRRVARGAARRILPSVRCGGLANRRSASLAVVLVGVLMGAAPATADVHFVCCVGHVTLVPKLQVNGIEVTQAVQTYGTSDADHLPSPVALNSLPVRTHDGTATYRGVTLVRRGRTIVRMYANVKSPADATVSASSVLYGTRNGVPLPGSPLPNEDTLRTLRAGPPIVTVPDRGDAQNGFTFTLPDSWTRGTITLTGAVLPMGLLNGQPIVGYLFTLKDVPFVDTGYLDVQAVKTTNHDSAEIASVADVFDLAKTWAPLADDGFRVDPNYAGSIDISDIVAADDLAELIDDCNDATVPGDCAKQDTLNQVKELLVAGRLEDFAGDCAKGAMRGSPGCPDQIVGVNNGVFHGSHDYGGLNSAVFPVQVTSDGPGTVAHEMGHAWGRRHASPGCGAAAKPVVPEEWPDDNVGYLQSVGLDRRDGSGQDYGGIYRPIVGRDVSAVGSSDPSTATYNPPQWYDFMSYCPGHAPSPVHWVSAKGWEEEVFALRTYSLAQQRIALGPRAAPRPAATEVAGVTVSALAVGGERMIVRRVLPGMGAPVADAQASPYQAVVLARDGYVLGQAPMSAFEGHVHEPNVDDLELEGHVALSGVGAAVPASVGAVEIVKDGAVLARRTRSAHLPTVTMTRPRAGHRVPTGAPLTVRWRSTDPDGTALSVLVDYSSDGGRRFHTVFAGRDLGHATIDPQSLTRSAHARVRVRVSDGFDQAQVTSGRLHVGGRAPDVTIESPRRGMTVRADAELSLAGHAGDDAFAALTGRQLRWFAGRRRVGSGAHVLLRDLRPGHLPIRLIASDHFGRTSTARTTVTVRAAEPRLFALRVPRRVSSKARAFDMTMAASEACKLTLGGRGVHHTVARLGRRERRIHVVVTPGTGDLRVSLALRSRDLGTLEAVHIRR